MRGGETHRRKSSILGSLLIVKVRGQILTYSPQRLTPTRNKYFLFHNFSVFPFRASFVFVLNSFARHGRYSVALQMWPPCPSGQAHDGRYRFQLADEPASPRFGCLISNQIPKCSQRNEAATSIWLFIILRSIKDSQMAAFNDFAMAGRLDDLVLFKCGRMLCTYVQCPLGLC